MNADHTNWQRPRRGLQDAWGALASAPRAIGYLGVSVTAQREGFRTALHDRLVRASGHAHTPVNAGVGALGSLSLLFLVDDLLLRRCPSLCFVECTTGDMDGKTPPDAIEPAVEGILRKLAAAGCAACVLHLYRRDHRVSWSHPVVERYERIAAHYDVPSLHVGLAIARDLDSAAARFEDWFKDAVHTTPAGSARTADLVMVALDACRAVPPAAGIGQPTVSPLTTNAFESGAVILAADVIVDHPDAAWEVFRLAYRCLVLDERRRAVFRSASHIKGLFVVVGPASEAVRVEASGAARVYDLRDAWTHFERVSTVLFDVSIPPGTDVTLTSVGRAGAPASPQVKLIGFLAHDPADAGALARPRLAHLHLESA